MLLFTLLVLFVLSVYSCRLCFWPFLFTTLLTSLFHRAALLTYHSHSWPHSILACIYSRSGACIALHHHTSIHFHDSCVCVSVRVFCILWGVPRFFAYSEGIICTLAMHADDHERRGRGMNVVS